MNFLRNRVESSTQLNPSKFEAIIRYLCWFCCKRYWCCHYHFTMKYTNQHKHCFGFWQSDRRVSRKRNETSPIARFIEHLVSQGRMAQNNANWIGPRREQWNGGKFAAKSIQHRVDLQRCLPADAAAPKWRLWWWPSSGSHWAVGWMISEGYSAIIIGLILLMLTAER